MPAMHFAGPVPAELITIPEGAAGVGRTLDLMVGLVKQYKHNPVIRETARHLVHGCGDDQLCIITRIQHFVRDQIEYRRDVYGTETLQSPLITLGWKEPRPGMAVAGGVPSGDCDDKATLLATLLMAVGIPGSFKAPRFAAGADPTHVLATARVRTRRRVVDIPCEAIVPSAEPGWYPPNTVGPPIVRHYG